VIEPLQKEAVINAKNSHDSVGGVVLATAVGVPTGLGEPLYYKLDALLAEAMMGINAVKAVEIGDGIATTHMKGSQNNDQITKDGFASNHAGGILGGISDGEEVVVKIHFKPTPSIFKPQQTINKDGTETVCKLSGRHDPCVAIRGAVVCEAMMALVLADMALLNLGARMEHLTPYTDPKNKFKSCIGICIYYFKKRLSPSANALTVLAPIALGPPVISPVLRSSSIKLRIARRCLILFSS